MKFYRIPNYIFGALLLSWTLSGCTSDDAPDSLRPGTVNFEVRSRADGADANVSGDDSRFTRLYVAERLPEHDVDHLHCARSRRYTVTDGRYSLNDLTGKWYKFAFVSVPLCNELGGPALLGEENPSERSCDFNKLLIDYKPVLSYQKQNVNIAATEDLNIYRRIIDRWIDPDGENIEDVVMTRISGELLIDMGIPVDQFEHQVKSISLTLEHPMMLAYIHDQARDEVIGQPYYGDMVITLDYSKLGETEYAAAMRKRQQLRLCLLPETLKGRVVVSFKNSNKAVVLPIGTNAAEGETAVEVRKNRVTTVLFNGMQKNEFEVRYAGFDDGDDSIVDVDDDSWDGWQEL